MHFLHECKLFGRARLNEMQNKNQYFVPLFCEKVKRCNLQIIESTKWETLSLNRICCNWQKAHWQRICRFIVLLKVKRLFMAEKSIQMKIVCESFVQKLNADCSFAHLAPWSILKPGTFCFSPNTRAQAWGFAANCSFLRDRNLPPTHGQAERFRCLKSATSQNRMSAFGGYDGEYPS